MITITREGTVAKCYINDQLANTGTATDLFNNTTHPLRFGGDLTAGGEWANGQMTFPKIRKGKALSLAEVVEQYNNGVPKCYDNLSTALTDNMVCAPDFGTYNGSSETQALTDRSGTVGIATKINGTTFTDQGLTVECTS